MESTQESTANDALVTQIREVLIDCIYKITYSISKHYDVCGKHILEDWVFRTYGMGCKPEELNTYDKQMRLLFEDEFGVTNELANDLDCLLWVITSTQAGRWDRDDEE